MSSLFVGDFSLYVRLMIIVLLIDMGKMVPAPAGPRPTFFHQVRYFLRSCKVCVKTSKKEDIRGNENRSVPARCLELIDTAGILYRIFQ